jgi:hypothetical protein
VSEPAAKSASPKDHRPQVFISYAWSSREHKQWVLDLAERLTDNDVHALLDSWDLKPGDDSFAYMERMVNDPEVSKVIIISDKAYVEKANSREGGVGTETQIITPELYGKTEQNKFVLVVAEKDDEGRAPVPTYYRGKIHIDLSDSGTFEEELDRLLRWIYEKPADVRPAFGAPPEFLQEAPKTTLGTLTHARRALDAMRTGKPHALGAFREYLTTLVRNLDRLRIKRENGIEFDDQVVDSFATFKPSRNEFAEVVEVATTHTNDLEFASAFHQFFEQIYPYYERPRDYMGQYTEPDWDNFRLIGRELFLIVSALALKHQRFNLLQPLVEREYYITAINSGKTMYPFGIIAREVHSLDHRKRRLQSRRANLIADLLVERVEGTNLTRNDLLQADFFLNMRSVIRDDHIWHPATHVYAGTMHRAFEVFSRASSRAFFERLAPVLGVPNVDELRAAIAGMRQYGDGSNSADPRLLTGFDELATRP